MFFSLRLLDHLKAVTHTEISLMMSTAWQWKSASMEDIRKHGHALTPGRHVSAAEQEDDGEPFEEKMQRLSAIWREQRAEAVRLDAAIEANLKALGYGG